MSELLGTKTDVFKERNPEYKGSKEKLLDTSFHRALLE